MDEGGKSGATDLIQRLGGPGPRLAGPPPFLIVRTDEDRTRLEAYRTLRRRRFVDEQRMFAGDGRDEHDGGAHAVVLVAVAAGGEVLGGVRVQPELGTGQGLRRRRGSRLVVAPVAGAARGGAGPALAGPAVGACIGRLASQPDVRLRWPDGDVTVALGGSVTGRARASRRAA